MFRNRAAVAALAVAFALLVAACGAATPPPDTGVRDDGTVVAEPTPDDPSASDEPAGGSDDESAVVVEPDPNFEEALREARLSTRGWTTDFSLHTVDYGEILNVLSRDGIPALDNPQFVTTDEADAWLGALEPVILLEVDGVAKAYPLQILTWHEIANDTIAGVPVAVTFCPLCNSAVVFDRRLDGGVFDFGVSGNLRQSDLIMWDRQTESWWQQLTGESIVGVNAGKQLTFIPAPIVSWETFKEAFPGSDVLSRDTGFRRSYGTNPYAGYDRVDNPPFLFDGPTDGQLLPKERVVAIEVNGVDAAFPFTVISQERAVNYEVGGTDLAVFFEPGTVSALDRSSILNSRDVGSTGVFDATLDGRKLTFRLDGSPEDGVIVDDETGSTWSILGKAISGELEGSQLDRILHQDHFWFAWAAFKPDTMIYFGAQ